MWSTVAILDPAPLQHIVPLDDRAAPSGRSAVVPPDQAGHPPGRRRIAMQGAHRDTGCARRPPARRAQRSPGSFAGLTDTEMSRFNAVRMMRFCSMVWAAG